MATFAEAYYAYLFVFCGRYVAEDALRLALAAIFHLLLLFCLWSYAQTTFTPPPDVPRRFQFTKGEHRELARCSRNTQCENAALEAMATRRGILTRCRNGAVSCCGPCQLVKPDRCHHCSRCKRCVLKMDHHCPWFNNCVCFSTYKFFVLTLFYVAFLAAYALASVSVYLLHKNRHRSLLHRSRHITFLVVVGGSTSVLIGGFLCMHLSLTMRNRTTLESTRLPSFKEGDDSFDVGARKNFFEVFGLKAALWLIPVFTSLGDGCHFPTKLHPDNPVEIRSLRHTVSADASAEADRKAQGEPGLQTTIAECAPKHGAVSPKSRAATTHSECASPTSKTPTERPVFSPRGGDSTYRNDNAACFTSKPSGKAMDRHRAATDNAYVMLQAPACSAVPVRFSGPQGSKGTLTHLSASAE